MKINIPKSSVVLVADTNHQTISPSGGLMKRPGVVVAALIVALVLAFVLPYHSAAQGQNEDVVYLKNGGVIRGVIIEQVPGVSLKIKTHDGNVFVYAMKDVQKMTKEAPVEGSTSSSVSEKSPLLAFVLSFILPGGGQYYNGDIGKGVIMTGAAAAGIATMLAAGYEDVFHKDPYYYASYGYWTEEETSWLYVGAGVAGAAAIWSWIDAPISASRINEERARSYGHMFEWETSLGIAGIDLGAVRGGVGAKFMIHL
jgi:TM2 domain-containing membrane protein YozV